MTINPAMNIEKNSQDPPKCLKQIRNKTISFKWWVADTAMRMGLPQAAESSCLESPLRHQEV